MKKRSDAKSAADALEESIGPLAPPTGTRLAASAEPDVPDPWNLAPMPAKVERTSTVAGFVSLTVTVGRQGFAPVRYHTFDVGPFSMTAQVPVGEVEVKAEEMRKRLRVVFRAAFDQAMLEHFELVKLAADGVNSAKIRGQQ